MKDYILITKKTLGRVVAAVGVVAAAIVLWWCMYPGRNKTQQRITVHSYNILRADGKDVLYFRSLGTDSVFRDLQMTSDSIWLAAEPHTAGIDLHAVVEHNRKLIDRKLRALDSIDDEMKYYLDVHNVQDEGYDLVVNHQGIVEKKIWMANKIKNILNGINNDAKLEIEHVAVSMREDSIKIPSVFMEDGAGIWKDRMWQKSVRRGKGVARDHSGRVISGIWNADTLTHGKRNEDRGTYHGQFSLNRCATGHGNYTDMEENFYEGHWHNDRQDGFGFAVNPNSIKAGEWQGGRYLGERMNYTSERIYGIDISRYQHGKGRKYYPIYWNRLRITSLGKISQKQIRGKVDYPVSFVYIKSTEGTSIRNKFYAADYRQAKKYGIYCGAYHFFSTKSDAASQARFFIKHSILKRGDLPPVLDVEPSHAQIMKMGGEEALFKAIRTWMDIVKRHTGVKPVLYVNQTFVNRYLTKAPDIKRDYNIWIARYGEYRPDVRLVYWQLSPDGKVDGIHGDVDINIFNGYQNRFDMFIEKERIK